MNKALILFFSCFFLINGCAISTNSSFYGRQDYKFESKMKDGDDSLSCANGVASLKSQPKMEEIIYHLSKSTAELDFENHMKSLTSIAKINNQFFSIKGGAAIVGDDLYVIVDGSKNEVLDSKLNFSWVGNSAHKYEIMFFDADRRNLNPKSQSEIEHLIVIIFVKDKIYIANFLEDYFGYYIRNRTGA